ncbi:M12 family metallo-peptidase [Chitinophagales bacterium]|nr:M12 family metallo-peptidase [Chitinophagales bacterium]
MRLILLSIFSSLSLFFTQAQINFWEAKEVNPSELTGTQFTFPDKASTFYLDIENLKTYAFQAPLDNKQGNIFSSPISIAIPMPDGSMENFLLVESPVYDLALTQKYAGIKTFLAYNPKHPNWYARFDITPKGFHAMIMGTDKGSIFIDPIMHQGDINHYFSYYKDDFKRDSEKIICLLDDKAPIHQHSNNHTGGTYKSFGSCELRTYRLAVSATGEYTQFHGGTVADAVAAQITTMNRVNGVFERDMAIHMDIIANNDLIIYTNPASDPFSNGNTGAMINENQTNTDAVIGSANYDIGHIFGTNSGGLAQLRSPCTNNKARGVTGSGAPIGDPFDIDYVAHEMGHQYGANHTQNNNCNRNNATAMEPGSASTIMGYAGICAPNVQNNSDDYFHGISMEEMGNFITGATHTCPVKTPLANFAPSVSIPQTNVTIPANTPFSLTAVGTDLNTSNTLTYCWEQIDNQTATMPPLPTSTGGPAFRSFDPTASPTRYFPNLPDVIAGISPTWEVIPSVTRQMNFRVVLRDNAAGGGCNDHADMVVNVDGNSGPFVVLNPSNSGITWTGNTVETVTWDVANTDQAPVSCSTANILISYDGGLTFPDTLASNVPNDGNQDVSVPNVGTSDALIIVQCANGTFYDVSNNTFTITPITNDFTVNITNNTQNVCAGDDATFTVDIDFIGSFSDPVALSLSGEPTGTIVNISANNQIPPYTAIISISNTASASGNYTLNLAASSTTGIKNSNLNLNVTTDLLGPINLTSPANGVTNVSSPVNFTWSTISNAQYLIELASDNAFTNILESSTGLTVENYTNASSLPANTTLYWRVTAFNLCDTLSSSTSSFTTSNCITYSSTDIPVAISASGTPTINSTLPISGTSGTIADLNVVSLSGTHTYISDLTFTLTSPGATAVTLIDAICNAENDFNIQFDDAAPNNNYPCPPVDGLSYQPANALSAFNGENADGTWNLTVNDGFNQDGGELQAWAIEICFTTPTCTDITENISLSSCDSVLAAGTWFYTDTQFQVLNTGVITGGCDSITNFNIQVFGKDTTTNTVNACDSAFINGIWYTSSQTISETNPNINNCDSTHFIVINISSTVNTTSSVSACDSAQVNGTWYFSSQLISNTFIGSNTCDSVHTVNLTINNSSPVTVINLSTCIASNVNSDTITLTNSAGCDSVVITNTTLLPGATEIQSIAACDSAFVAGTWYTNSTIVNDTLAGGASNGCDSIITYNILINQSTTTSTGFNACDSAFINGNWYFSSQNIVDTNATSAGCDSIHIISLIINSTTQTSENLSACDSANINGTWYFSSQVISNTFLGSNTCDSVHTVNLSLNNSITTIDVQSACGSYTWIDGNTYSSSTNSPTIAFPASNGCDSIIRLDLTILNPSFTNDVVTACDSFTWINGITYFNTTNSPSVTLTNSQGCDSIVRLDLTISFSNIVPDVQIACDSFTWIDGNTYTSSTNSPTFTLTNSFGCDSIVLLNLTVNSSSFSVDNVTACDSLVWIDGVTYTSSTNTPVVNLTNSAGCDSSINLNLTIINPSTSTDVQTACGSFTWIDGNTYTSSNNTATFTIPNGGGCDSVVTLDLTIFNPTTGIDVISACGSYTWIDGISYSSSNNTATYTIAGGASNGCDSIASLDLTIINPSLSIDTHTACDQFTWIDGITYTSSNNFASFTIPGGAANGCDSIVLLDLTIFATEGHTYVITACDSFTWVNGVTYTSSILNESFTVPGATSNGCDSLYVLDLTIIPSGSGTDVITACGSYTWIDGITYTSSNNTAEYNIAGGNANGCDIEMSLDLTILPLPNISLSLLNGVLSASPGLMNYQWYRNGQVIPGANSQTYTPTAYGSYTCSANNGNCDGLSNGILISITDIKDFEFEFVGVYPNPVSDYLHIDVGQEKLETITLFDITGKRISELNAVERRFYMGDYATGVYLIELKNGDKRSIVKVILE